MGTVLRNIQWPTIHNPPPSAHFNTPSARPRRHRTPNSRNAWQTTGALKRSNSTITDLDVHPFLWHENSNDAGAEGCDCHLKGHTHAKYMYIHLFSLRVERHANSTTKTSTNAPLILTESKDNVHKTWWERKVRRHLTSVISWFLTTNKKAGTAALRTLLAAAVTALHVRYNAEIRNFVC